MTRKRFTELTKELLETCIEEIEERIDCDNWEDLTDGFVVDLAYSISNIAVCDYSIKDIENIYDFVYHKPFVNIDEQIEYVAIMNELKELED